MKTNPTLRVFPPWSIVLAAAALATNAWSCNRTAISRPDPTSHSPSPTLPHNSFTSYASPTCNPLCPLNHPTDPSWVCRKPPPTFDPAHPPSQTPTITPKGYVARPTLLATPITTYWSLPLPPFAIAGDYLGCCYFYITLAPPSDVYRYYLDSLQLWGMRVQHHEIISNPDGTSEIVLFISKPGDPFFYDISIETGPNDDYTYVSLLYSTTD